MCGIAAIIGRDKQQGKVIKKMLLPILHRGEKKYFNESLNLGNCVLGTNRLAIVEQIITRPAVLYMSLPYVQKIYTRA